MSKFLLLLVLGSIILLSCKKDFDRTDLRAVSMDNIPINVIASSSNSHLAFPDLIRYHDKWYITYRESDGHLQGKYSKAKVLCSSDFENWAEIYEIEIAGYDIRDPGFTYNSETDSLYLHFHSVEMGGEYGTIRSNQYITYDNEKQTFSGEIKKIVMPRGYENEWLWKPIWHNGKLYSGGYNAKKGVRVYCYDSLESETPQITQIHNEGTETAIHFFNGSIYYLIRGKKSYLGISNGEEVTKNIRYIDLKINEFGGPELLVNRNTIYIGGRVGIGTSLMLININKFDLGYFIDLPSSGDCSYPSFEIHNSLLYGVYYSEGSKIITFTINVK